MAQWFAVTEPDRHEYARRILALAERKGLDTSLNRIHRQYRVWVAWYEGNLATGYLIKLTGVKRKDASNQTKGRNIMTTDPTIPSTSVVPLLFADISDPGGSVIAQPGLMGFFFYLASATPHAWTPAQIEAQTLRYAVPIWVKAAARDSASAAAQDATAAVGAMRALKIPPGTRLVLDMETMVNYTYSKAFRDVIASAGYWTTVYGSKSTVFRNYTPGGGYWVADWTGRVHEYPGDHVWATQYADPALDHMPWDLSEVADLSHTWDRRPPLPSAPKLEMVTPTGAILTSNQHIPWV
jgi:Domain of unknown function (DUF1906)